MVPVLVRDDVRLGEAPALGAEPRAELVVEAQVEVHLTVARAVERADRRVGDAAPGRHLAVEQHGLRGRVALHRARPVLLHGVDDARDQAVGALVGVGAGLAVRRELARALEGVRARPGPPPPPRPLASRSTTTTMTPTIPPPPTAAPRPEPDAAEPARGHRPRPGGRTPGWCRAGFECGTSRADDLPDSRSGSPLRAGRAPARPARCAGSRSSRRRSCRSG